MDACLCLRVSPLNVFNVLMLCDPDCPIPFPKKLLHFFSSSDGPLGAYQFDFTEFSPIFAHNQLKEFAHFNFEVFQACPVHSSLENIRAAYAVEISPHGILR